MSAKRVIAFVAGAALCLLLVPISCGSRCQTTRDCSTGQFCDFETGVCIDGCDGPEDCSSGVCDFDTGRCKLLIVRPGQPDAMTSTTSTTTDAGTSTTTDSG